jgi:hypothetical protein
MCGTDGPTTDTVNGSGVSNGNVRLHLARGISTASDSDPECLTCDWELLLTVAPQGVEPKSNPYQTVTDYISNVGRFKIIESTLRGQSSNSHLGLALTHFRFRGRTIRQCLLHHRNQDQDVSARSCTFEPSIISSLPHTGHC